MRVWWDGNGDWFDADVISFDAAKRLHLLQYCADGDQAWEDLAAYAERGSLPSDAGGLIYSGVEDLRYRDESGQEV